MNSNNILVIDIGGTFIKWTIANSKIGKIHLFKTKGLDKDGVLKRIAEIAKSNEIKGIAISAPGSITADGFINGRGAIPKWENFNLIDELKNLTSISNVIVINDGCASAYACYKVSNKKNIVALTIGTAVGAGVIIDGKLITGNNGFGGQLGYIPINGYGFDYQDATETFGLSRIVNKYYMKTKQKKEAREIFELYDNNDVIAKTIVNTMLEGIAKLVLTINVFTNPNIIYVSGGISKRKTIVSEIKAVLKELIKERNINNIDFEVEISPLEYETSLNGALWYYQDQKEREN